MTEVMTKKQPDYTAAMPTASPSKGERSGAMHWACWSGWGVTPWTLAN